MTKNHALNLEKKILQKDVVERLKQNQIDESRPWVIELDPTTACNLACHGCISANLLNQGGFKRERIKELAKEFYEIGVKAVVLIGGGEPMAHPEFGTLVDYFYNHDIHVGVTSNGTLIDKYLESLAYRTKWVRISVDAGCAEVFQEYRPHVSGKSQFNKVIEGMKKISKIKKTKLGYSFLVLEKQGADRTKSESGNNYVETNATDIFKAAKLAKEIGCDYFEVKPSFDPFHFLNDTSKLMTNIIKSELDLCKSLVDDNFNIISPYTLEKTMDGEKKQEKNYSKCLTAEMRTVLSPSGAYVCPYHRGNTNLKIGDPTVESLRDIWFGKTRKEIMEKLDPRKHCQFHCIRHKTNIELEKLDNLISNSNELNHIENFDRFI
jgi:sulfatase maturation enzyme AslB (radical SAM superfamily)